jgi:hypothetical protein
MTLHLDPPRNLGGLRIAALCEHFVGGHGIPHGVAVIGQKRPVAILILGPDELVAFSPRGVPMDVARLEMRHPGLGQAMRAGA